MAALLLLAGAALLYLGGEGLVRGASDLATRLGVPPILVGLTVVAFGTSAPELAVSLRAAVGGNAAISVGNVVGSNVCNIGLILGLSALLRPLRVESRLVRWDVPLMIAGSAALTWMMLADGRLGRLEGLVLVAGLAAYLVTARVAARREPASGPLDVPTPGLSMLEPSAESAERSRVDDRTATASRLRVLVLSGLLAVSGVAILVLGAKLFVDGAVAIAERLGVSQAIIGLTVVAIGTSLPELATSLVATVRGEVDLAVGNVVGSNLFNILGILGLTGTLVPLSAGGVTTVDFAVMSLFALAVLPIFRTGYEVSRVEGGLLLAGYVAYLGWLSLSLVA